MTEGGSYAISPAQSLSACGLLSLLGDSIFSFQKRLWARSTNIFKVIPRSLTLVKSHQAKAACAPPPGPRQGRADQDAPSSLVSSAAVHVATLQVLLSPWTHNPQPQLGAFACTASIPLSGTQGLLGSHHNPGSTSPFQRATPTAPVDLGGFPYGFITQHTHPELSPSQQCAETAFAQFLHQLTP